MSLAHDIREALDAMPDKERADLEAEAEAAGLSTELALVAKRLGMTAERYVAYMTVTNHAEAVAVRQRFADRDRVREQAAGELAVEREKLRQLRETGS